MLGTGLCVPTFHNNFQKWAFLNVPSAMHQDMIVVSNSLDRPGLNPFLNKADKPDLDILLFSLIV